MLQGGNLKRFLFSSVIITLVWAILATPAGAAAGIRQVIQFQGKVVNANGTNVTDGTYDFVLKLYDGAASNSTALFTETWSSAALWSSTMSSAPISGGESLTYGTDTNESTIKVGQIITNTTKSESVVVVAVNTGTNVITISPTRQAWANGDTITNKIYVKNGIFQVGINSLNADMSGVDFNTDTIFVGINFNADGEMKPRIQYSAVPYAMNAKKVGGLTVTDTTGTFTLAAGKTLTVNNTITFSGTDSTTLTLPGASDTLVGLAATQTLTNKTFTAPKFADGGYLADASGNELLILDSNASAVNEITVSNGATTVNPKLLASGETNVGLDFETKGTGTFRFVGTATQAAELRLYEDTDNGTNSTAFKVGTQAGDITYTLPTADGTGGYVLSTNGTGTLSWIDNGAGGAPTDATYLTLGTNGTLSGERVLTGTTNQISLNDAGANGNLTLSTPQDIHTSATPQFATLGLGAAAASDKGILISSSVAGTSQYGLSSALTFSSGATTAGYGINIAPATQATSFTMANLYGLYIADASKGAGSTITTLYGLKIADMTTGATNYSLYTGTAQSYFGGNVGIKTTAGSELDVKGTLRLSGATSGYVGFAPAAAAGSTTYTLPSADGSAGQVLKTDGAAGLSWASVVSRYVQTVSSSSSSMFTASATIPTDDTIPQNTEGTEFITATITPTSATNKLIIEFSTFCTNSSGISTITAALFQDSTASALSARGTVPTTAGYWGAVSLNHELTAGTTSATTFKIRIGGPSGSVYCNANSSSRYYGGTASSWLRIYEVDPSGTPTATTPAAGVVDNTVAGGRLTLTSATPVTTSDVTGATTIYYSPYKGNRIALYDGANWNIRTFSEKTCTLTITCAGGGTALESGKNYDVFLYDNAGTVTVDSLVAWTSDTARSTNIELLDGVYVKSGASTRRYVGTFRTTSTTATEDSVTKRFVWSMHNRVDKRMYVYDSTTSWPYSTQSWREARGQSTNRLQMVIGVNEDAVSANVLSTMSNSTANRRRGFTGVGYDTTSSPSGIAGSCNADNQPDYSCTASVTIPVGIGYHYLSWLETGAGTETQTWYGGGSGVYPTGIQGSGKF